MTMLSAIGRRLLAGFDPDKLSGNVLRLHPGVAANAGGSDLLRSNGPIDIDVSRTGTGGLDNGQPVSGENYFVYLIGRDGAASAVISRSISYSGVATPPGWTLWRKLPFGFVYNTVWGGIPSFHCSYWPGRPAVRLTDAEYSIIWMVTANLQSDEFKTVDCSGFLPDNARVGLFQFETRAAEGGQAGSAYVRSYPGQIAGVLVGFVNPSAPICLQTLSLRVTSRRQIEARTAGDARLNIYCLGYDMTEPS
jgi:hypothetical protein